MNSTYEAQVKIQGHFSIGWSTAWNARLNAHAHLLLLSQLYFVTDLRDFIIDFLFSPNPNRRGQHWSLVQPGISFWKKIPYGLFCCLSERLFQDTSLAPGIGPAVIGPVYLVGISAFLSHPSYERPCFLALLQPDLFRGKLILLQKANAKINPYLLESGEVAGKRRLCECMLLIPCYNQPPPIHITAAQNWEQPPLLSCAQ